MGIFGKKAQGANMQTVILIALVVGALFFFSGRGGQGAAPILGGQAGQEPVKIDWGCVYDGNTLSFEDIDAYDQGVDPNQQILTWLDGEQVGVKVEDSGTRAASPGDTYKALFGWNSTSYTSTMVEGVVDCKPTQIIQGKIWDNSGTLTLTWINKDKRTVNANAGNNQSIAANDELDVLLEMSGVTGDCYGAPSDSKLPTTGHVQVFRYNSSHFDSVKISDKGNWESEFVEKSTPSKIFEILTGYSSVAYNQPDAVCGASIKQELVRFDAGATDPAYADTNMDRNDNATKKINVTIFDVYPYIEKDGSVLAGATNSSGQDHGSATEFSAIFQYS